MKQYASAFAAFMLMLMSACMAAIFYFLFLEEPYLVYQNVPFPPTKKSIFAGEVIPVRVKFCNNSRAPTTFTLARSLQEVDTRAVIFMPDVLIRSAPGCREAVSLAHVVPHGVPPGNYRLIGLTEVQGTLHSFQIGWESGPFEVLP